MYWKQAVNYMLDQGKTVAFIADYISSELGQEYHAMVYEYVNQNFRLTT